jgi:hypothetical protein
MSEQTSKNNVVAKSIAVTRKLAVSIFARSDVPIGPEFLAAGILKAMTSGAETYLRQQGLNHVIPCLEFIPDASPADMDRLPPVILSDELNQLLKGELSGFVTGQLSAPDALHSLWKIPGLADRLVSLPMLKKANSGYGASELMSRVTGLLQFGYRLACTYYSEKSDTGMSDFAVDRNSQAYLQAVDDYRKQRDSVRAQMYSGPRGQKLSVFERYMRSYGPIAADVATAVVVNELTPFVRGGSLATVRDIAYTIAPDDYHRMAGKVIEAVHTLRKNALVRLLPEPDNCQMFSCVLPAETLISDFTQYLGPSDDW